jgi:hypothetical protein
MVDGLYALVHVVYLCLYPPKRSHPLTGDRDPDYHCLAFYIHQLIVAGAGRCKGVIFAVDVG